jgi:hypothetical protein
MDDNNFMSHVKIRSPYIIFQIWDKKKGLKNSSKRNNVKVQFVKTSNENINDSEDINP